MFTWASVSFQTTRWTENACWGYWSMKELMNLPMSLKRKLMGMCALVLDKHYRFPCDKHPKS